MLVDHQTEIRKIRFGNICTYCEKRTFESCCKNATKCDYSFNNLLSTSYLFMLLKFNISQVTKLFTYQTFLTSF